MSNYLHPPLSPADDASMFELAPVSLWLEDASGVKRLFESWEAAGMLSLRDWLNKPDYLSACVAQLKILKVNAKTLELFEAADFADFIAKLPKIVTTQSLECLIEQWVELWSGQTTFYGKTVNTTANGRVLDVQIRGSLLPGYERNWDRVLVTVEDVTDLETARREAAATAVYARGLFEHSPVALWVKDFSGVRHLVEQAHEAGIRDLADHFRADPAFALCCLEAIKVIDVNRQALMLFAAKDKDGLLSDPRWRWDNKYREGLMTEIVDLWHGKLFQQREMVDRTLDGRDVHVHLQLSVLPGYESDWAKVQIARIDISDRKKAEDRLRYVSQHDPVTNLYNRSFFIETLEDMEASAVDVVTVIMIDLNGLKTINDTAGHAEGDHVLRRMANILLNLVQNPSWAARIGGDEFAIVMPGAGQAAGRAMVRRLQKLVEFDNEKTQTYRLSLSTGVATRQADERLETVVSRADEAMYERKAAFYARRSVTSSPPTRLIDPTVETHGRHSGAAKTSSTAFR